MPIEINAIIISPTQIRKVTIYSWDQTGMLSRVGSVDEVCVPFVWVRDPEKRPGDWRLEVDASSVQ